MITKFFDENNCESAIEFQNNLNKLEIYATDNVRDPTNIKSNTLEIVLSEQDLFNLIGQLLRIQSEVRKEVQNG